ncbi:hypothetical protein L4D76_01690 [Photobacterium sagamiensis]|uniref:hypothetical protein n=1 Tax=Photobacterium sagamiensis TaxID=2910241 RepID=UPI003D11FF4C
MEYIKADSESGQGGFGMYGVIPDKNAVNAFYGRVPCVDKNEGYKTRYFSLSNYSSPYDAASKWVNKVGVETWGLTRWLMIKEGKLRRFPIKCFFVFLLSKMF